MFHGLHFIGIELEEKFVDLGQQNIDLWNRRYGNGMLPRWGSAIIIQGDSRNLLDVLEGVQGVIASPPYVQSAGIGLSKSFAAYRASTGRDNATASVRKMENGYGTNPANLGNMREGDVDAVVSSPPFSNTMSKGGETKGFHSYDENEAYNRCKRDYIQPDSPGQLAAMPVAVVSSPPWENQIPQQDRNFKMPHDSTGNINTDYGDSNGQLGTEQGDTFWSAAKTIVEQCYQILSPGGVAIFVTKRFVRNKQIVEFSQQWADLCKSCGFVQIEWIKAWLIEDKGTQYTLDGNAEKKEIKRASFFRRLYESKYPENSIDWEDVLVFRKSN